MRNRVTEIPAASPEAAAQHFAAQFRFETDCWDVHEAMQATQPGFVLIDARSEALFAAGHLPGAISLPHRKIIVSRLSAYPADTLFVCYCAGPHCNGAARACLRLAELGFRCKLLCGGVTGWLDEGFALVVGASGA